MPSALSSSALPMPDSSSVCGELIAPPLRITSRRARAVATRPPFMYSTPTARRPSNTMRVTSARVLTSTLPRCCAGRRCARAALQRQPL